MSLEPPSTWIEPRGRQQRVYWRNPRIPGLPARSSLPFYSRDDSEQFTSVAGLLGMDTARRVLYIKKVLIVLGQCFDLAIGERPLPDVNPARGIRLPE
jgi:hypothetical protein